MEACARKCTEPGITRDDLTGPQPSPVNFKPGSKHFEYTWVYPKGSLLVVVADDGGYTGG